MASKRGRPPYPDVLTPAEWRVVDGVREGCTNAEIAETLGVSVNTVRYHVSNILSKIGLDDRNALATWRGRPRRFRLTWPLPLSWLVAAGGAVALGVVMVWTIGSLWIIGGVDARTVVGFETRAASDEFVRYGADYLEQSGLVDAGRLLENADGAPFEVMYRPGWAGVRTPAQTWVADSEIPGGAWGYGTLGWSSSIAAGFTKVLDGRRIYVTVSVMDLRDTDNFGLQQQLVQFGGLGQIAFRPHEGTVSMRVSVTDQDRRGYPSVVDEDGHLWVAVADPIADDEVVAYDTGEALRLDGMTVLADFYGGASHQEGTTRATVFCREDGVCEVTAAVPGGAIYAPVGGLVECSTSRETPDLIALRITSDDLVFEMRPVMRRGPWRDEDCEGFPRMVAAGEALPFFDSYWNLRAWDGEGQRLDVIMSWGRMLYLGDAQTSMACPPCVAGS